MYTLKETLESEDRQVRHMYQVFYRIYPAFVAQLEARPTSDQEVAGSTPSGSATSFLEIWS